MLAVRKHLQRLARLSMHDVAQELGDLVADDVQDIVKNRKRGPNGESWRPWTPRHAEYRRRHYPSGGMLYMTGAMHDSIRTVEHSGTESQARAVVGSDMIYAGRQQDMRPFMGLSDRAEKEIEDLVEELVLRALGGRA